MTVRHVPAALQQTERATWIPLCTCGREFEGGWDPEAAERRLADHLEDMRIRGPVGEQGTPTSEPRP